MSTLTCGAVARAMRSIFDWASSTNRDAWGGCLAATKIGGHNFWRLYFFANLTKHIGAIVRSFTVPTRSKSTIFIHIQKSIILVMMMMIQMTVIMMRCRFLYKNMRVMIVMMMRMMMVVVVMGSCVRTANRGIWREKTTVATVEYGWGWCWWWWRRWECVVLAVTMHSSCAWMVVVQVMRASSR